MATLTKSTGTVTLSGAVEKVTFPASYGWVWVKNMSDADMFVGLSESVSAGADGVLAIPAGECGRVQTDGQDSVYLIGSGNALVVAQNYADCPFKVGAKGGEIPDLSAYAKTADVPNIKVNSAVNADTVDGHSVGCDVPENAVFTDTVPDLSPYAKKTDVPNIKVNSAVDADTVCKYKIMTDVITINSDSGGYVWLPGKNRIYISTIIEDHTCTIYIDVVANNTNLYVTDAKSKTLTIHIAWLET